MINRGSEWRRWEPHIHTPGTVFNNQFGVSDPWETYLNKLETIAPSIEAIGVTDYYMLDKYEVLLHHKKTGRLPNVQLLFPNIELRLDVAAKSGFVNIHLLVSPEDEDHLDQIKRILSRLQFAAFGDVFDCTHNELIRLGKKADPSIIADNAALEYGATQYKVNFKQLREVIEASDWAKSNILVAVAGGSGDGTSGVRQAADATTRQEIEKFAHVIFASSASQREFWLGQKGVTALELKERYNGCKPCLHGSDAHDQDKVGEPTDNRFSWIKGGVEFDALRQACIDPEWRAFVGSEPPPSANPSQVISKVEICNANWATAPTVPLNSGLVAIIGARGSGKTALADIIAAGCDAIPTARWHGAEDTNPSFLRRASSLMGNASVKLNWKGSEPSIRNLDGRDANSPTSYSRARYLSQQFVNELCSDNGISTSLLDEIERVIFNSHSASALEGAIDFSELREQRVNRYVLSRERGSQAVADQSERISAEREKEGLVEPLTSQIIRAKTLIDNYVNDRAKLVVNGTPQQVQRHTALSKASQAVQTKVQQYSNQRRTFVALQDEVGSTRATTAPEMLRQAQFRHSNSGLDDKQWSDFLLIYNGDVDKNLAGYLVWVDKEILNLTGDMSKAFDVSSPIIAENADLKSAKLNVLNAEINRLETLVSADQIIRGKYSALTERIRKESVNLQNLETKLADAKGASARRTKLQQERNDTYLLIFKAIESQTTELEKLYEPLKRRLSESDGTLSKLSFSVKRVVDVETWAKVAEERLLDLRTSGSFQGKGALTNIVNASLKTAWETGTPSTVQAAMINFMGTHLEDLLKHAPYNAAQPTKYREWLKDFAGWLYGTNHITVRYEILYDGVDIRKLSPGTRGVVLLMLYLALDDHDDRPLIIDQPEENLDPKSVFDELVPLFTGAKSKRQVIMVTHNANLVINTNADQVIIAQAGPHPEDGGLPSLSYTMGGLENAVIRNEVCAILEGGEEAFKERARRLRVRLDR